MNSVPVTALRPSRLTRARLRREQYLRAHGDPVFAEARLLAEQQPRTPQPRRADPRWIDELQLRRAFHAGSR